MSTRKMSISNLLTDSTLARLRDKKARRTDGTFKTEQKQGQPLPHPSGSDTERPHASSRADEVDRRNSCGESSKKRKHHAYMNMGERNGSEQGASEDEPAIVAEKETTEDSIEAVGHTKRKSSAKRHKQVEADSSRQPSASDDRATTDNQDEHGDTSPSREAGDTSELYLASQSRSAQQASCKTQVNNEEPVEREESTLVDGIAATTFMETSEQGTSEQETGEEETSEEETSEEEQDAGSASEGELFVERRERVESDESIHPGADDTSSRDNNGGVCANTGRGITTGERLKPQDCSEGKVAMPAHDQAPVDGNRKEPVPTSTLEDGAMLPLSPTMTAVCPHVEEYFTVCFPRKVKNRRGPRCHFKLTKLALLNGVKPWRQLKKLKSVNHAGEDYQLGDLVYIRTDEKASPTDVEVDSAARIRDIRETEDGRERKEICISWLWSKEQVEKDCENMTQWPHGATHIDTNWLQALPWDTIDGRPTKADVRTLPKPSVVLDACSKKYKICRQQESAVEWASRLHGGPE